MTAEICGGGKIPSGGRITFKSFVLNILIIGKWCTVDKIFSMVLSISSNLMSSKSVGL